ncbi:enolase-phosphatase E1 [Kaistia sp. 32K]|uniref:acireductone synthase n=1 Tax=Kaistia sp. 32K TaxID=2795690 RepID=UPI001915FDD2|nr:acireductone synthase [Kaistia sp. 32K]BCP55505.1 enolase-phosphatase E1 [Kaistia sp. 32K]
MTHLTFTPDVVLLDIEGTISSQSHVTNVLYAYLRERLPAYVAEHRDDPVIQKILADTIALSGTDEDPVETLLGWLAEDKKAPPLKKIQGLIWEHGYAEGAFTGHIFDDALAALQRWHAAGVPLYIFSSGSIQSQVQFFQFNQAGDLRSLFNGHFDTDTGAKVETASYGKIAEAIGVAPERLLFFSDNPRELVAATAAKLPVVHVLREDTAPDARFPEIRSFDEVELGPRAN